MKITVSRSGGFAGLTRVWAAEITETQHDSFRELVDSCPWQETSSQEAERDRFIYIIEAGQHSVTLGESALTEPWKSLVKQTQQADAARRKSGGEPESGQ